VEELPSRRAKVMIRAALLMLVCAAMLAACGGDGEYDPNELTVARQEKDAMFRDSENSPIPIQQRSGFTGLKYFDPDPEYVVTATFTESSKPDTITLQTSKASKRQAVRAGRFSFELQGKNLKLWAYTFIDAEADDSFFVPFTDKTTGHETYYGGRYLDVPVLEEDEYLLDFNQAYNPFCAYNPNFTCPLVPAENDLSIAVRAGEKK
jgi:uncharacterized protein (DUF1684 family)